MPGVFARGSLTALCLGLLAAGVGVPIPEDPLLLAAGALAHRSNTLPVWSVFVVVYLSALSADCGLYFFARHFGEGLLVRRPLRWLATPRRRERVSRLMKRYGSHAIFWGRHVAGLRTILFVMAGAERVPFFKFLFFDALAAFITIPIIFGLGYAFSNHLDLVRANMARFDHWLWAALGLALLIGIIVWSVRWSTARPPFSKRDDSVADEES